MRGYCQDCKKLTEMSGIYTDRLPNGEFVNKGSCSVCGGKIWKRIGDNEILVSPSGRRVPEKIYAEEIITKKIVRENIDPEKMKTLKELKQEVGSYEKENFINR